MSEMKRDQLLAAVIAGRGPAYLRGVDLSSCDLSNAGWLIEADLRNADLSNANMRRANLRKSNLEGANLHAAGLLGANLEEANLFKVKANVANLNMANLRKAILKATTLVGATLVKADLEEADLEGADLEGANLQGCNLRRARLVNANLKMANLDGADLTDAVQDNDTGGARPEGQTENGEPVKGFIGSISSIRLADLIQLGCLSRSNFRIEVSSGAKQGDIYIGTGRVLHAEFGKSQGEEALFRILAWDSGRFTTYPYTPGGVVTIDKPVEHLLLQAHRLQDENAFADNHANWLENAKEYLPAEVRVSEELATYIAKEGKSPPNSGKLEITGIFDPIGNGDELLCSLSAGEEVYIAPLKYISLEKGHPLAGVLAELESE